MARRPRSRTTAVEDPGPSIPTPVEPGRPAFESAAPAEGTTGRYLVLMQPNEVRAASRALENRAGLTIANIQDFASAPETALQVDRHSGLVLEDLGVAIVNAPPDQIEALGQAVASENSLKLVEPERIVYAIGGIDPSYLRGYRDAINHLVDRMLEGEGDVAALGRSLDETAFSWGLQATGVDRTGLAGRGIKIAILDTGLDLRHPDFIGRTTDQTRKSFIPEAPDVQDGHGHGTHCAGLACGPQRPNKSPRYGVAYEAELYVGKVLNDAGRGIDGSILQGLQWAIQQKCEIISMSLGARTFPGGGYSQIFEQAAQRALALGSLIVAAAGNDSRRPASVASVSHPANCPSIVAVAAVDRALQTAWFSNGGLDPDGGQIDIAAPGVDMISSWTSPTLYKEESGTSMATPTVAGIAALYAQADPTRGKALLSTLLQHARRTSASAADVGMGIVQAPRP